MSLDWSIKKIANKDEVCFSLPALADSPHNSVEKGERYLCKVTDTLIWLCMGVGLGGITEKNHVQFFHRVRFYEHINGTMLRYLDPDTGNDVDVPITLEDVRRHIGLSTNVSNETESQFANKMMRGFVRRVPGTMPPGTRTAREMIDAMYHRRAAHLAAMEATGDAQD